MTIFWHICLSAAPSLRRLALIIVLRCLQVGAPWVNMHGESSLPFGVSVSENQAFQQYSVPIVNHRLHPTIGYDESCVGNLDGVQIVPPLKHVRNHAMVAPVAIGTPKQQLSCILDAASADLWLPSARCKSCAKDENELASFFDASKSNTFHPEIAWTPLGPAPRGLRVVYSGGSVAGYIVNDTVSFGSTSVPQQTFLLAEEGDSAARKERAWDGVCGIGWGAPEHGGAPFYRHLEEQQRRKLYTLSPGVGDNPIRKGVGSLLVGEVLAPPDRTVATWSVKDDSKRQRRGLWVVNASVAVRGGHNADADADRAVRLAFETGTSYLLVPHLLYIQFVRSLFSHGSFERKCGMDHQAGNVVICDCSIKNDVHAAIVLKFLDIAGQRWEFPIQKDDLLEVVADRFSGRSNCVLQVQPRPQSVDLNSPAGVLGAPLHQESKPQNLAGAGPLGPFGLPFGPGPAMWPPAPLADADRDNKNSSSEGLSNLLDQLLGGLEHAAKGGVVKEVVVETLGDGTRCETDVVRSTNGTIVNKTTEATDRNGKELRHNKVTCAHTRNVGNGLFPMPTLPDQKGGRRLSVAGSDNLWVIGHVFLKRYTTYFDFENSQVGFIRPLHDVTPSIAGAKVEAFEPIAGSSGVSEEAIQTYSTVGSSTSSASGDSPSSHLQKAVWHLLGRPDREALAERAPSAVIPPEQGNKTGVLVVVGLLCAVVAASVLRGGRCSLWESSPFAPGRRESPFIGDGMAHIE